MNCPQCSQPVIEGAQTCSHCGASLAAPASPAFQTETPSVIAGTLPQPVAMSSVAAVPETVVGPAPATSAPGSTAGAFPQSEEAPTAIDTLKDGFTNNPVADVARGMLDKRRQRKEEEKRQAEALAAAQAAARHEAFERISKTAPLPIQEEKIALPAGLDLYNDEFYVTEGRDWGITTKKLIVTTKRLIHVHGLLTKDQELVDLVNVQDVSFRKSLIFHGELEIETSGGHSITGLPRVKNGKEFRNQILLMVNWAKSVPTTVVVSNPTPVSQAPAAPPPPDKYEQLKKLGDLKAAGVLSDAEFEAEKAKLLGT